MNRNTAFVKRVSQIIAALFFMISFAVVADELTSYVQKCESELEFSADQVPWLNCNDGTLFKGGARGLLPADSPGNDFIGPLVNDFVGHAAINTNVDLVFACRWLQNQNNVYHKTAVSIELIIHNRSTGGTCFFAAKDSNPPGTDPTLVESVVSTTIVSPTDPNASGYWMQPTDLNAKKFSTGPGGQFPNGDFRCMGCHIAGPYIASPDIAHALQKFGLLNDGHDTFGNRYYAVLPPVAPPATQSAFLWWTIFAHAYNVTSTCANGCHSIGFNSPTDPLFSFATDINSIVPSLQDDIGRVDAYGVMPANNPSNTNLDNSYNWVNMNTPLNTRGDFETLSGLQYLFPRLSCANPAYIEAHVVDSDEIITTNLPDRFHSFNLQDGLVCLSSEQTNGHRCRDYQTRYMCNGKFTAFQNNDDPGGSGDWEPRNTFFGKYSGSCPNPTWIQARFMDRGSWVYINGPADRLAEFDNNGLVCHNADQTSRQCSNYVVRFICQ